MWLILFQKYWLELLLLVASLGLYFYISNLKNNLDSAIHDRDMYEQAMNYQNASLLKQKEDYEKKLSELPKEIEKITVKYKVIYQGIDDWQGDKNATDCTNADSFLRSINY